MKKLFLTMALTTAAAFPALAGMQHDHSSMPKMEGMSHKMEALETKADGFDVSFDIMTHKDYQKMMKGMTMEPMKAEAGTTHHVAVTIRKDGKRIEDTVASLKVISPDKKEETHELTYNPDMMNQYVGHFNMAKKGKYSFAVSFKVGNDSHQSVVYYEIK